MKYNKKRHQTEPEYFLRRVYSNIITRCTNPTHSTAKYYFGLKYCNEQQFFTKFLKDKSFLKLYKQWQKSNFKFEKTPSVDRINKNKGYLISNLQFLSLDKNCGKEKKKLPILMFDLEGNFIKEFESKWAAHKELGIPNGNICKVVYGKRKSAGGYVFKFK